eukprot:scaffold68944_cov43-Prasinocladus_malaysianus.AAC.1
MQLGCWIEHSPEEGENDVKQYGISLFSKEAMSRDEYCLQASRPEREAVSSAQTITADNGMYNK